MPRKKSIKRSAQSFKVHVREILDFLAARKTDATAEHESWLYDYAIIRLYREFESLILDALVGAINNDTSALSGQTGISFPKHLTDEVCNYIVTSGGYFDFKGRAGLIGKLKRFLPGDHYLVSVVKPLKYKDALEKLSALRNLAAHTSLQSKRAALTATNQQKLSSAGDWLKRQGRFEAIAKKLVELAEDLRGRAPY